LPAEKGAPEGRYTVLVEFIVDKEGNLSDIKALTSLGYGMEDEAMRVIRQTISKGLKWKPAEQNGIKVKAFRKQPITFIVSGE
jgi:periplasmic protein TonB